MPITIDNPTAESIYAALQSVPPNELARLREMLTATPPINRSTEWSDEDLADFSAAQSALTEEIEAQESQNVNSR